MLHPNIQLSWKTRGYKSLKSPHHQFTHVDSTGASSHRRTLSNKGFMFLTKLTHLCRPPAPRNADTHRILRVLDIFDAHKKRYIDGGQETEQRAPLFVPPAEGRAASVPQVALTFSLLWVRGLLATEKSPADPPPWSLWALFGYTPMCTSVSKSHQSSSTPEVNKEQVEVFYTKQTTTKRRNPILENVPTSKWSLVLPLVAASSCSIDTVTEQQEEERSALEFSSSLSSLHLATH